MHNLKLGLIATGLFAAVGCDYSGDWLFAEPSEDVPGVIHLGEIEPATLERATDIDTAVIYGEVGATGNASVGGVTMTFRGTGSHVCVWVDPELVHWNQSVSPTKAVDKYAYPDNVFDDGDLDLSAGFSAYYNGTPGQEMGDFEVRYEDSLGNPIEVGLNECNIPSMFSSSDGHGGRGAPEYCTLFNTQDGVSYTVALETWSTPLDDNRLGYGVLVSNGTCDDVLEMVRAGGDECVIMGEAVSPGNANAPGPWYGISEVPTREGSVAFEQVFCAGEGDVGGFCENEAEQRDCGFPNSGCFCGNPEDTPTSGSY
jgi:hypothetical protein